MNKNIWLAVLVVVVIGLGVYAFTGKKTATVFDPLNATYSIANEPVALVNGKAEVEIAPGSASKMLTDVFGEPVAGDLNGDGKADAALILTRSSGGSGTFYYAAAAISGEDGAIGTNAILLGDRIAPQNIEIKNGRLIANYADRKPDEPMATPPSVGVSKYMMYDGAQLKEVAP